MKNYKWLFVLLSLTALPVVPAYALTYTVNDNLPDNTVFDLKPNVSDLTDFGGFPGKIKTTSDSPTSQFSISSFAPTAPYVINSVNYSFNFTDFDNEYYLSRVEETIPLGPFDDDYDGSNCNFLSTRCTYDYYTTNIYYNPYEEAHLSIGSSVSIIKADYGSSFDPYTLVDTVYDCTSSFFGKCLSMDVNSYYQRNAYTGYDFSGSQIASGNDGSINGSLSATEINQLLALGYLDFEIEAIAGNIILSSASLTIDYDLLPPTPQAYAPPPQQESLPVVTSVPESTSIFMFVFGLLSLLLSARRKV